MASLIPAYEDTDTILRYTTTSYPSTRINPLTQKAENYVAYETKNVADPFAGYSKPKDTSRGSIDNTIESGEITQPKYTAESVKHYALGVQNIMKAGADITNGYLSKMSADSKKMTYEFQAQQNISAAETLLKNQKDITRAAQMDASRYTIQGAETKAKQKTAMAASGFAVGKGVYKNTLSTTDARVNYNVANLMLTSELQNAEITRKAGALKAQAIIDEANAKIAKIQGEAAVTQGWINGISGFISAATNFYCGMQANNGISGTTTFKNRMGGTSTIVHGGYTKINL